MGGNFSVRFMQLNSFGTDDVVYRTFSSLHAEVRVMLEFTCRGPFVLHCYVSDCFLAIFITVY